MRARPHRVVVLLRVWGRLAPVFEAIVFLIFIQFTVLRQFNRATVAASGLNSLPFSIPSGRSMSIIWEVFGLRRLLVQRAGEAGVDAFVVAHEAVIKCVGHVHEPRQASEGLAIWTLR